MTKPELKSPRQEVQAPRPSPSLARPFTHSTPSSSRSQLRIGIDSKWRGCGLRVSLCSHTAHVVMIASHERLRPLLDPSKPPAGCLCIILPPN